MAFKLGDEEGFRWVGAYEISADDLLDGKESHNFLENPHSHQLWSWSSQKKEKLPYPICSVVASGIG